MVPAPALKNNVAPPSAPIVKQIRGSSLLLLGRVAALLLNFCTQLLLVRYLTKSDYGAFAYALAVIAFSEAFSSLGLRTAVPRFVPIYHERRDYSKLFGTICLSAGAIVVLGFSIISLFVFWPDLIRPLLAEGRVSLVLLSVMIFLVPVEALDLLLVQLFASFGRARAIFFRKHLLGPGLKFTVVLLLVVLESDLYLLAYGYVAASAAGLFVSMWAFLSILREEQLVEKFSLATLRIPFKEVLTFVLPGLSSDVLPVVLQPMTVLILGHFHSAAEVAAFSAVYPLARLNRLVLSSMTPLYMPSAARLFARGDYIGIRDLYQRITIWVALFSFPIFAATFSLARTATEVLYGERYANSAIILALLSLGFYVHSALGCLAHTLKVLGKLRALVTIDAFTLAMNLALSLYLIPSSGAFGAAIAASLTMIMQNILMYAALQRAFGFALFDSQNLRFYFAAAGSALGLLLVQWLSSDRFMLALLLVLTCLAFLAANKKRLHVGQTFPEVLKVPFMRALFS